MRDKSIFKPHWIYIYIYIYHMWHIFLIDNSGQMSLGLSEIYASLALRCWSVTRRRSYKVLLLYCLKVGLNVVIFLPAGCREAANCRYCFYSQAKNQVVFRPAGATRCTDSGQTLQDRRAPGSAWLSKISR